jgi:mannose-6-phosphate isomerase-like protein (cupin superfamily)
VLSGGGRAKVGDEIVELKRLDALRVSPQTWRAFEAGDDGLELLAFGAGEANDAEMDESFWPKDAPS